MTDIKLNEEEQQHLRKINKGGILGLSFIIEIQDHFNVDMDAMQEAFTTAERKEAEEICQKNEDRYNQKRRGVVVDEKVAQERTEVTSLKMADVFIGAARRLVGNDKEVAALLPANLNKKDADLLEKCEMKSLAALVRIRV